ncbi:MAG: hypothetical protein JXJ20_14065 [Anaerolineae bacterium]|jgi:hypothetical protein|nr:hypothetical protein [Anaerolineae bacterium]
MTDRRRALTLDFVTPLPVDDCRRRLEGDMLHQLAAGRHVYVGQKGYFYATQRTKLTLPLLVNVLLMPLRLLLVITLLWWVLPSRTVNVIFRGSLEPVEAGTHVQGCVVGDDLHAERVVYLGLWREAVLTLVALALLADAVLQLGMEAFVVRLVVMAPFVALYWWRYIMVRRHARALVDRLRAVLSGSPGSEVKDG